jgi:putative transcriptional regulator
MQDPTFLTGHLLIAMPTMRDPNFARTVTYVCEHTAEGALGIIINRPMDMDLGMIFQQLALTPTDPDRASQPVLQGGPVSQERGFVLHAVDGGSDGAFDSTLAVTPEIRVTTSQDILAALAAGRGPRRALLALGYAGWGAGQLESEMSQNAWLTVPASPEILFDIPFERRWHAAARLLGIDLATLSSDAGHA